MIIRELTAADRPAVADIYLVDRQRFFPLGGTAGIS